MICVSPLHLAVPPLGARQPWLNLWLVPGRQSGNYGNGKQHEKDDKQDLRNPGGGTGNVGKTKQRRYQSDNEKNNSPV